MILNMVEKRIVDCIYDNENWLIIMLFVILIVMNVWDIFVYKLLKFVFVGKVDLLYFIYYYW